MATPCELCGKEHLCTVKLPTSITSEIDGLEDLCGHERVDMLCPDCVDAFIGRKLNQERLALFRLVHENDVKMRLVLEATNRAVIRTPTDFVCGCGKKFESEIARALHIEQSALDEFDRHWPNGQVVRGGYRPPIADPMPESKKSLGGLTRRGPAAKPKKKLLSGLLRR